MFRIKQLFIYPIKGLSGFSAPTLNALSEGFEYDRRWMLIDESNSFISQRSHKILVDFKTAIENDQVIVTHKGQELSFSIGERNAERMMATIWDHTVQVNEVSDSVSGWFSECLRTKVKLVVLGKSTKRIKKYSNREGSTEVSFADGYPYLIIGTASLKKLNEQLETPVEVSRFRGNIIVETNVAHEEDDWNEVQIGNAILEVIKPCARCQVINIDQENGQVFKEPLKTLSTYRKNDNKIYFGANVSCKESGSIKIGDILTTTE